MKKNLNGPGPLYKKKFCNVNVYGIFFVYKNLHMMIYTFTDLPDLSLFQHYTYMYFS